MRRMMMLSLAAGLILTGGSHAEETNTTMETIYRFTMDNIDGKPVALSDYAGKVVLVVNVASRCGFTGQYKGLQALYEAHREEGFAVLGFPANDFMGQEPGNNAQIKAFCSTTYDVTFPMFAKISVKGDEQHPLYAFLTAAATQPEGPGPVSWNFNKFLIGRDGRVAARFGSRAAPEGKEIKEAVQAALSPVRPGE